MGEVTHEQANLLLKLYDMRREPALREAREWYAMNFHPTSLEDLQKHAPMGSKQNANMRMVVSYWEMAASIVNRGLINEEFFFENSGEQWMVWERLKPVIPAMRALYKNPHQFENLEKHVEHFEVWREKRAPGTAEAMRQMMSRRAQVVPKAAGKKR
jgi:hypothetical protein